MTSNAMLSVHTVCWNTDSGIVLITNYNAVSFVIMHYNTVVCIYKVLRERI